MPGKNRLCLLACARNFSCEFYACMFVEISANAIIGVLFDVVAELLYVICPFISHKIQTFSLWICVYGRARHLFTFPKSDVVHHQPCDCAQPIAKCMNLAIGYCWWRCWPICFLYVCLMDNGQATNFTTHRAQASLSDDNTLIYGPSCWRKKVEQNGIL